VLRSPGLLASAGSWLVTKSVTWLAFGIVIWVTLAKAYLK
jgi:hypothetical protein